MPNVLVRNISHKALATIKERAARAGHSVQEELRLVLAQAVAANERMRAEERVRQRLAKHNTE